MNNYDFRQHFINAANAIGINNIEDKKIIVEPVDENKSSANEYDFFMSHSMFPKARTLTFEETLKAFTQHEGYYPLRIDISERDGKVYLKASMRMRKAGDNDDKNFIRSGYYNKNEVQK